MKENINRNRTNFDGYKISYLMISNYWFLGFVEGDGSFFLCNNRAIFSITQKDRQVLEAISLYIKNIQRAPIFKGLFVALQPNCIISGKNNNTAYQLIISDLCFWLCNAKAKVLMFFFNIFSLFLKIYLF